jgi:hypothetical protein
MSRIYNAKDPKIVLSIMDEIRDSESHPDPMTDQKPNCSTCSHCQKEITGIPAWICHANNGYKEIDDQRRWFIEFIGCLSHQDARAYLMAPVIKELERLSKFEEPRIYYIPQIIDLICKEVKK